MLGLLQCWLHTSQLRRREAVRERILEQDLDELHGLEMALRMQVGAGNFDRAQSLFDLLSRALDVCGREIAEATHSKWPQSPELFIALNNGGGWVLYCYDAAGAELAHEAYRSGCDDRMQLLWSRHSDVAKYVRRQLAEDCGLALDELERIARPHMVSV